MPTYLGIADWIAIVLGSGELTPNELVNIRSDLAQGALEVPQALRPDGSDLYPDMHAKAAVLLDELLACHAIMDEDFNRNVSVLAALLFLDSNGHAWRPNEEHLPYWVAESARGRAAIRTLSQAIAEDCDCPAYGDPCE